MSEPSREEVEALLRELDKRRDFMNARGYSRCDIAACNCDSWHSGHAERRLMEAHDAVYEAGGSTNGVILTDAILALGVRITSLLALAYDKDTGEAYIERAAISEELRKEALARVAVLESALIDAQTYIDECLADDSGSVLETVHAALHPKGQ